MVYSNATAPQNLPGALGAAMMSGNAPMNPSPAGLLGLPGYEAIVAASEAAVRASMAASAGLGTGGSSMAPPSFSTSNIASAAAAAAQGGSLQSAAGDGGGLVDINAAALLQGAQPPPGKWKLMMVPCDEEAAASGATPPDTGAAQAAVSAGAGVNGLGQDSAAASVGLQLGLVNPAYNHILPGQGIDVGSLLSQPGAVNSLPQWLQAQLSNPHQGIGAPSGPSELNGLTRAAGADQGANAAQ